MANNIVIFFIRLLFIIVVFVLILIYRMGNAKKHFEEFLKVSNSKYSICDKYFTIFISSTSRLYQSQVVKTIYFEDKIVILKEMLNEVRALEIQCNDIISLDYSASNNKLYIEIVHDIEFIKNPCKLEVRARNNEDIISNLDSIVKRI